MPTGGGAVELATLEATQGNNAVELQEIDTGKPQPEQDGGGTPDGGGRLYLHRRSPCRATLTGLYWKAFWTTRNSGLNFGTNK